MSTFLVFGSGNEFCAEEDQNPLFDPLPRNEKLCGNNNVRNCDLLQIDFFARCMTVLGVAKGFFCHVVKLGER